jgi:hypothetical protein
MSCRTLGADAYDPPRQSNNFSRGLNYVLGGRSRDNIDLRNLHTFMDTGRGGVDHKIGNDPRYIGQ